MYEEWLETCSEKELFVFYESQFVSLLDDISDNQEWIDETVSNMQKAVETAGQYSDNFQSWYIKWLHWFRDNVTNEEWLDWLRKMPWNLEKGNA